MKTYSLLQVNQHLRRVVALNFSESVWISCEIAQSKAVRGHWYLDLVEKAEETGEIVAQSRAMIWSNTYQKNRQVIGNLLDRLLEEGTAVRIKARPEFHEHYGVSLLVEEIDPTYTLGKLELERRKTIETLKKAGLLAKNKSQYLPIVLQRIAVISSEKAAGFEDFKQHLATNVFSYYFKITLFPTVVQGANVEKEVIAQLNFIEKIKENFDCIVIIRGGGAKIDLAAFDQLELNKALANAKLPILTGIGHEIDETVADLVAFLSLKTPTAVADFLINRNLMFESAMDNFYHQIEYLAQQKIHLNKLKLQNFEPILKHQPKRILKLQQLNLDNLMQKIKQTAHFQLKSAHQVLESIEKMCNLLSLENTLKRGYSITSTTDGKVVRSAKKLKKNDLIETQFLDGKLESKVV